MKLDSPAKPIDIENIGGGDMDKRFQFGYFQTMEQAQKAADALRQKGFEVSVDRFSPNVTGQSPEQDILLGALVEKSGLSGGHEFIHPEDVCVTAFCEAEQLSEVRAILEEYGAKK